jgi:hypothetical protein
LEEAKNDNITKMTPKFPTVDKFDTPTSRGYNPGSTDSDTIESDIRKKYSGLNEQYKKNRK